MLCALLMGAPVAAQQARWSAPLPTVGEKGVHAIALSAELLGASRADLGDIRLLDSAGAEVPYVLREVERVSGPERFVAYGMLRNAVLKHRTEVEIERPADQAINELHVWIKPVEAEKRVRITGSDDRTTWYMVKDEHVAARGARGEPPHQVLALRIPRTDYRYLRLTLNDSLTAPMKVLGVGRFVPERAPEAVFAPPVDLRFIRSDTAGRTTLRFALPNALLIERMAIEAEDTLPFMRSIGMGRWRTTDVMERRHLRQQRWFEQIGSFVIRHGDGASFGLMPSRLDTFELRIDNGDDRPLRIKGAKAQCRERVLLARLEPGMPYRLVAGNVQLTPPRYDMAHFADELPVPLDTLRAGPLVAVPVAPEDGPRFDPDRIWVWAGIIALIALMGWMAMRMLRKPV